MKLTMWLKERELNETAQPLWLGWSPKRRTT